jgi:hypothetical protein
MADPGAAQRDAGRAQGSLIAGEHLYAQTARTFRYLQARFARGELSLPQGAAAPGTFGQQARHRGSAGKTH